MASASIDEDINFKNFRFRAGKSVFDYYRMQKMLGGGN